MEKDLKAILDFLWQEGGNSGSSLQAQPLAHCLGLCAHPPGCEFLREDTVTNLGIPRVPHMAETQQMSDK